MTKNTMALQIPHWLLSHLKTSQCLISENGLNVVGPSLPNLTSRDNGALKALLSPVDDREYIQCQYVSSYQLDRMLELSRQSQQCWRTIPAPVRAQLLNEFLTLLKAHKQDLAHLITLEVGKIQSEALGEVQEAIDICEFAIGLSRQLYGLTMASERSEHQLFEHWQPLGIVAIISAFNFPIAVWAWNAALAIICGNSIVWKPSEKTPLCALACQSLFEQAQTQWAQVHSQYQLKALSSVVLGGAELGQQLCESRSVALVSATGSIPMGQQVAITVAKRLGRSLLELGGNNAMIVSDKANRELALKAALFSALGTCGQRCTSLRRLYIHQSIYTEFCQQLRRAYQSITAKSPLEPDCLLGPLIDSQAVRIYLDVLNQLVQEGAHFLLKGEALPHLGQCYVSPSIVEGKEDSILWQEETFAPLLYVFPFSDIKHAIALNNSVTQGLSSAIITDSVMESGQFLGPEGSDCGIANVNVGTSGAEIGAAFGGEKDTGGGRESGSDAWKQYMRRVTSSINYSQDMPLSQGVRFDVD